LPYSIEVGPSDPADNVFAIGVFVIDGPDWSFRRTNGRTIPRALLAEHRGVSIVCSRNAALTEKTRTEEARDEAEEHRRGAEKAQHASFHAQQQEAAAR